MKKTISILLAMLAVGTAQAGSFSTTLGAGQVNSVLAAPGPVGSVTPNTGAFTTLNATSGFSLNSKPVISSTIPTIASGFGTAPSIQMANGTASFRVNVGTGGTASSGVITMPTAQNGWSCAFSPVSPWSTTNVTVAMANGTNSIYVANTLGSTGGAQAWSSGFVFSLNCVAY